MGGKGAGTFFEQPKALAEQVRMVKKTQNVKGDAGPEERRRMHLVKKIVEATQCSQADAEIALFDAENNVDAAVIAIIEKAEKESTWTESKSRKTRKDEKVQHVTSVGRGFRSGGRGGATYGERRGRGAPRADVNSRSERPTINSAEGEGATHTNDRGVRRGRGIRGGGRGNGRDYAFGDRTRKQDNPENAASEENASFGKNVQGEHDEFNWHKRNKDKPLVFTRSDQSSQSKDVDNHVATTSQIDRDKSVLDVDKSIVAEPKTFVGCAAGPISFAAAAAGRKLAVEQKVADASAVKTAVENEATNDDTTTPAVYQSALLSSSSETTQEVVESTLVDESKNEIASHTLAERSLQDPKEMSEEPFVDEEGDNADDDYERSGETAHDSTDEPTEVSEPAFEKEVSTEPKSQHFEVFKADTISVVGNGSTAVKDETFDTNANIQQRSSSSSNVDLAATPAQPVEASGEKDYVHRQLNQQLSYGGTKNLSFPPESYAQQQQTRQQQPSQQVVQPQGQPQSQHPVYPPQVPYGNFPYMYPMYNPMGNMRNEDQYNAAAAAFMHNYQSLLGFDMNALAAAAMNTTPVTAPQQQQQQQRPDNSYDHKSYHSSSAATGSGTSTNVPPQRYDNASTMLPNAAVLPPPGFSGPPSNMAHYMQHPQQNLSSLLTMPPHPQYPPQIPFSFMMPNVPGNPQQHNPYYQDDGSDPRMSGQRIYGQQGQMDKYGSSSQKERLGSGTQPAAPSQMGYGQYYGNYTPQMHGSKKNYGHHNWNA